MASRRARGLVQAAAPVLVYLTTFRRNAASTTLGTAEVRDQLKRRLESFRTTCELDSDLGSLAPNGMYVLVALCDGVLMGSPWKYARDWAAQPLERDYYGTLQGGRRFYEIVREVLADIGPRAPQMAELLFQCLGLGFQGELMGKREELTRLRRQLYEKARLTEELSDDRLTPGAYGQNVTKERLDLPLGRYTRMLAAAAAILVFTFVGMGKLVGRTQSQIIEALEELEAKLDARGAVAVRSVDSEPASDPADAEPERAEEHQR